MAEGYFNYFTEIEEHFRAARGSSFFVLSPRDWVLLEGWKKAGIPLETVLRGIDTVFEKWKKRAARGFLQPVNSLSYCAAAVAAEMQAMARVASRPPTAAQVTFEDVRTFIRRNISRLRKSGCHDFASRLESLDLEGLYTDLELLEQKLTAIEEEMLAWLHASASEEATSEARRALDRDLRPYRGKMSADQLATLEKQFLERRLLESARLPRLSLFYMR